jgi:hypothetical protein
MYTHIIISIACASSKAKGIAVSRVRGWKCMEICIMIVVKAEGLFCAAEALFCVAEGLFCVAEGLFKNFV